MRNLLPTNIAGITVIIMLMEFLNDKSMSMINNFQKKNTDARVIVNTNYSCDTLLGKTKNDSVIRICNSNT